jgi:diacylglycerol kinase family enzyme
VIAMQTPGEGIRVAVLVGVLILALVVFLLVRRAQGAPSTLGLVGGSPAPPPRKPLAAVVVHSGKVEEGDSRRRQIEQTCDQLGWQDPVWLETSLEDAGTGPARDALLHSPDVVLAFGGDGTVRAVADVLTGTGIPLGLLPAGTGNLLARNLGVPHGRLDAALRVGLLGPDRSIDVGRAEIALTPDDAAPARETFLVMAGLGFDAEVMAGVDPELKQRLGWGAYLFAGAKRLSGRRTAIEITVDDGPPQLRRVRAVLVGNCGTLQAGIQLMPDAEVDDGLLDVLMVAPRSVLGWLSVTGAVLARRRHPTVERLQCRSVEIRADRALHVQLDGDPAGTARVLRARVDPGALTVRVPD